jgi:uncharacterized protein HemY
MKKPVISSRDVKMLIIGMVVAFAIVFAIEWRDAVRGFKDSRKEIAKEIRADQK